MLKLKLVLIFVITRVFVQSATETPPKCGTSFGETSSASSSQSSRTESSSSSYTANTVSTKSSMGTETSPSKKNTTRSTEPSTSSTTPSTSDEENRDSIALLETGDIHFTGEFLYQLLLENPTKNVVTSGFSLLTSLGQLGLFSTGEILKQILSALNLSNKTEIESSFKRSIENYRDQKTVVFKLSNAIFVNERYQINQNFKNESQEIFAASAQNINFDEPQQAADTINDWVADNTDDKIQNLVSANMFDDSTVIALVNAIWFKGNWQTQFNPNDTMPRDFYVSETDIEQVPTMYQKSTSMLYGEDDDVNAQIINMPYEGGNFSCGVILPRNITGLLSAVEALRNSDKFVNIFNSLSYQTVDIYLPKMEISTKIDLPPMLTKLNVGEMFDPDSNGFRGILQNDQPVYISSAVEEAWIKLDEEGVEAVAANGFVGFGDAIEDNPTEYIFNADHQFILYILFLDKPIFSAIFAGPQ